MRILIVEDEIRLAQALEHILCEAGYEADAVNDGQSGLDWALATHYDAIILDVMLPKRDGMSVASELRRAGVSTPILMLTAKSEIADKITGLDSGADDYMTKPFSPSEMLARIRALTRRQGEVVFEKMTFGDLTLLLQSYDLLANDKQIHLSFKEFNLLRILMANPKQVVSKETLIDKVWGYESSAEDNNVEAYVSFVRKKLQFLNSTVSIETVRKAGYRLVENAPDATGPKE